MYDIPDFLRIPAEMQNHFAKGGMIKRADGSYSRRGLWDNIRANKGSGKKPTKQMLEQEARIKAKEYVVGGPITFSAGGEKHKVYEKESPTGNGKGVEGHIMVTHPTMDKGKWDTIDLTKIAGAHTVTQGVNATKQWHEENPEYGGGGYIVRRSHDRKGKTHVVIGPDGTKKYFGDANLGQHPHDAARKKAFYARHKHNLANNPYFRAFARKTWEDGGEVPEYDYGGFYGRNDAAKMQRMFTPNADSMSPKFGMGGDNPQENQGNNSIQFPNSNLWRNSSLLSQGMNFGNQQQSSNNSTKQPTLAPNSFANNSQETDLTPLPTIMGNEKYATNNSSNKQKPAAYFNPNAMTINNDEAYDPGTPSINTPKMQGNEINLPQSSTINPWSTNTFGATSPIAQQTPNIKTAGLDNQPQYQVALDSDVPNTIGGPQSNTSNPIGNAKSNFTTWGAGNQPKKKLQISQDTINRVQRGSEALSDLESNVLHIASKATQLDNDSNINAYKNYEMAQNTPVNTLNQIGTYKGVEYAKNGGILSSRLRRAAKNKSYNEGDELDLTAQEIYALEKQGYKFQTL
jgi:hypothetical protein